MAAFATAIDMRVISLGSRALGIRYLRPNDMSLSLYAVATMSGTGSFARDARASTAAIFISSFIFVARTSSAPLNM